MITSRYRHNLIWKKIIAAGVVCLFLANQPACLPDRQAWAYPQDALAPPVGKQETYEEMLEKALDWKDAEHQEKLDKPLSEKYDAHRDYLEGKPGAMPKVWSFEKTYPELIAEVVQQLRDIGAHGCPIADKIADKLEALAESKTTPDGYTVIEDRINLVEEDVDVKLPHPGGFGINIPCPRGMVGKPEMRPVIARKLLHEAMAGCVFGERRRVHELADAVVEAVDSGNFDVAAKLLLPEEISDNGIAQSVPDCIAQAAVNIARYVHDGEFDSMVMSGGSASLSHQLFTAAWKRLYGDRPMPRLYMLDQTANFELYRKRSWEDLDPHETEQIILKHLGTAEGEALLNDLKTKKVVHVDDVAETGNKVPVLTWIFEELQGAFPVSFALITAKPSLQQRFSEFRVVVGSWNELAYKSTNNLSIIYSDQADFDEASDMAEEIRKSKKERRQMDSAVFSLLTPQIAESMTGEIEAAISNVPILGDEAVWEMTGAERAEVKDYRDWAAAEASIALGDPIHSLDEVPGFSAALQQVSSDDLTIWNITRTHLYDNENNRYRLRWARGMIMPVQLHRTNGAYELLIDETYRDNAKLREGLATNGWSDMFVLHQALSLDMTLRHLVLLQSDRTNGASVLAIEAAKIEAARGWMRRHFPEGSENGFLGTRKNPGLANLLDKTCANGHRSRFTRFYRMVEPSQATRRTKEGVKYTDILIDSLHRRLRGSTPGLKKCDGKEIVPLLMEINPVDGRKLAREICDMVARPEYSEYRKGNMKCEWPKIRLTYAEELALFKALQEDPSNEDVRDAFVHCNALIIRDAMWPVIRMGLHKYAHMEIDDVRQICNERLAHCLRRYRPSDGKQFSTYLTTALYPGRIINRMFETYRRPPGDTKVRRFGEHEDGSSETDDIAGTEATPLKELFGLEAVQKVERVFAALSHRERLVLKLLYGIRFESSPDVPWAPKQVGRLLGVERQRIHQIEAKGAEKIRRLEQLPRRIRRLTDGDIFLATEIGLLPAPHPNAPFFPVFCKKKVSWLKGVEGPLRVLVGKLPESIDPETRAKVWDSFENELRQTAKRQLAPSQKTKSELAPQERKKYEDFKKLVHDIINRKYKNDDERKGLLDKLRAYRILRTPIRLEKIGTDKRRRVVDLSLAKRGGKVWRAYNADFDAVVYVIPEVVNGRLNISVLNTVEFSRISAPGIKHHQNIPVLYNAYWDEDEGKRVAVSAEYGGFFTDSEGEASLPGRQMQVKATISGREAYLEIFDKAGQRGQLYIDPRHAYLDADKQVKRIFYVFAFRDGKGGGVTVRLSSDGPIVGKAYYVNGEFVPEPSPLLRSRKHGLVAVDRSNKLIERLRLLKTRQDDTLVVRRKVYKRQDVPRSEADVPGRAQESGEKVTRCSVSPFGRVEGKSKFVEIYPPGDLDYCHIKFIAGDNAFEAYHTEACPIGQAMLRKFYDLDTYDLDTLEFYTPNQELKRRFIKFVQNQTPNGIVVQADSQGRIHFADGLWTHMGRPNAGRYYFIFFDDGSVTGTRSISLYQMGYGSDGLIRPMGCPRRLIVKDVDGTLDLEKAPHFKPYSLKRKGIERLRIQGAAFRLGYGGEVEPTTHEEEELIISALSEIKVPPELPGMLADIDEKVVLEARDLCALIGEDDTGYSIELARRLIKQGIPAQIAGDDVGNLWVDVPGYVIDLLPRDLKGDRIVVLRKTVPVAKRRYRGKVHEKYTQEAQRLAKNDALSLQRHLLLVRKRIEELSSGAGGRDSNTLGQLRELSVELNERLAELQILQKRIEGEPEEPSARRGTVEFSSENLNAFYNNLPPAQETADRAGGGVTIMLHDNIDKYYKETQRQDKLEETKAFLRRKGYRIVPYEPDKVTKGTVVIMGVEADNVAAIDDALLKKAGLILPLGLTPGRLQFLPIGEYCILGEELYRYKHNRSAVPAQNFALQFQTLGLHVNRDDIDILVRIEQLDHNSARAILLKFVLPPICLEVEQIRQLMEDSHRCITEHFA